MKYQVVVQWPATSIDDYDQTVEIENLLIERLSPQNKIDGHDFGLGEANIFVHTDEPQKALEEIRGILAGHRLWTLARMGYRQNEETEYYVLWPPGATTFTVL
jgi:hypothetical protein